MDHDDVVRSVHDGFNPTLVRLSRLVVDRVEAETVNFNPTLVRLSRRAMEWWEVLVHISNPTLVRLSRHPHERLLAAPVLPIPRWFD